MKVLLCVTSLIGAQKVFGEDVQSFNRMCNHFLIGKAGKACWGLLSQARELQVLEGLTCLSEELGLAAPVLW